MHPINIVAMWKIQLILIVDPCQQIYPLVSIFSRLFCTIGEKKHVAMCTELILFYLSFFFDVVVAECIMEKLVLYVDGETF